MTKINDGPVRGIRAFTGRGVVKGPFDSGTISIVTPEGAFWPVGCWGIAGEEVEVIRWSKLCFPHGYENADQWARDWHNELEVPAEDALQMLAQFPQADTGALPGHLLRKLQLRRQHDKNQR